MRSNRPRNALGLLSFLFFAQLAPAQPRVLILGDRNSEGLVSMAMRSAGLEVTTLSDYTTWDGLTLPASDYEVILFLCGYDYGVPLKETASQAIAAHVSGGGGLVLTEWAAYDAFTGTLRSNVADLMPVISPAGGDTSGVQWNVTDPDHEILTGFPASWIDDAYISEVELREGAQSIVADPEGTPLVSLNPMAGGPVVHINHGLTYSDVPLSGYVLQLLVNAVLFAAGEVPQPPSGDVLLLSDGGSEFDVATALQYAGFDVVFGGFYTSWDGAFPSLEGFDSVVFLDGVEFGKYFSPDASMALSDFVMGGGGLVVTEWTSYDVLRHSLDATFAALMPVIQPTVSDRNGGEWTIIDPGHPLATSLPSSWSDEASFSVVEPMEGATVIARGPEDIPMVTEKAVGAGKVVHLNHSLAFDTSTFGDQGFVDPHILRLIVNAVSYFAGVTPPNPNDTGDVLVLGDGLSEAELINPLMDAGFEVWYAGRYDSWDGVFPDPLNYKATLFLDGYLYGIGMDATAEQSLANAVSMGKGLVTTEWISYDVLEETLSPAVGDLLPIVQPVYEESDNATWTVQDAGHPILDGLPSEWSDAAGFSMIQARDMAEVLVTSGTGTPMVTHWDSPGGTVVHLNHSLTYTYGGMGPEIRQLLINSLRFAGGISSTQPMADLNGDGNVDDIDLLILLGVFGSEDTEADLDGSGMVEAPDVYLFSNEWKADSKASPRF